MTGSKRRRTKNETSGNFRRGSRPRPSSRGVVLIVAVPVIAFALLAAYIALSRGDAPAEPAAPSKVVESSAAPLTSARIARALTKQGIESNRIRPLDASNVSVETTRSAAEIATKLRAALGDVPIDVEDRMITIRDGGAKRRIRVDPLKIADSGAGLVEADSDGVVSPPPAAISGRKRIALILDDVGFENQPLAAAADLDVPLSFAVIPNTARAVEAARMLNRRGHEVLCHLPMEPIGFPKVAPGANAILTTMDDEQIRKLTAESIRAVPHARGVNNHMGSRATGDRRVMASVLAAVRDEGAFFVDSRTAAGSVGATVARELNVRTVSRDVFLDDEESEAAVRRQVERLAEVASARGVAVGIGHVYPVTIRVLKEAVPELRRRGFEFVLVSEVVQ